MNGAGSSRNSTLARRIVPCLDVRGGQVVKGVQFRDHEVVGDIVPLARRYAEEGADELVFYDITASSDGREVDRAWVEAVARAIDIPFCVAGGIASVAAAREVLLRGADKVSVNSPALARPALVSELAEEFGQQCVVVGIDSFEGAGEYRVRAYTGDPDKTVQTAWRTEDWLREVVRLGAGEVVLNCMNRDGVRRGYDLAQLRAMRAVCPLPLVISGGAGEMRHFAEAFDAGADAALAASVFHRRTVPIPELKRFLGEHGVTVRLLEDR